MNNQLSTLDADSWKILKEQCQVFVKSGLLPQGIKNVEQALVIAVKGHELGIPIMQSFAHINIIQGKPTISSELMMALIHKHCPGAVINFTKLSDDGCSLEAWRPGGKMHTFKFDAKDAKAAGLLGKHVWKMFPRAMMRSRTVSEAARSLFPDAIMGCSYTPEELAPDMPHHLNEDIPVSTTYPTSDPEPQFQPPHASNIMELVKKEPAPKKVFDKDNPAHLKRMDSMLDKKGIEKESWKRIYEKMNGKPSSELDNVLTEYYNEVFTKKDDEEEFEIPFAPTSSKPVEPQGEDKECTAKQQ